MAQQAREAASRLAQLRPDAKNDALIAMAGAFTSNRDRIKAENLLAGAHSIVYKSLSGWTAPANEAIG